MMLRIARARNIVSSSFPSFKKLSTSSYSINTLSVIGTAKIDKATKKQLHKQSDERIKFLTPRKWDNSAGNLSNKNLPYFINKLEKYGLQTTDEKLNGFQESSSFLGELIRDKPGIVNTNIYSKGS